MVETVTVMVKALDHVNTREPAGRRTRRYRRPIHGKVTATYPSIGELTTNTNAIKP